MFCTNHCRTRYGEVLGFDVSVDLDGLISPALAPYVGEVAGR